MGTIIVRRHQHGVTSRENTLSLVFRVLYHKNTPTMFQQAEICRGFAERFQQSKYIMNGIVLSIRNVLDCLSSFSRNHFFIS